ncbi:hypothetical protein ADJ70_03330 [Olsenella sp. oral taxon 807]|nr:hypothetical protein ADJ70_03330 [Olsenella sp. oral taxon 807]
MRGQPREPARRQGGEAPWLTPRTWSRTRREHRASAERTRARRAGPRGGSAARCARCARRSARCWTCPSGPAA